MKNNLNYMIGNISIPKEVPVKKDPEKPKPIKNLKIDPNECDEV